MAHFMNDFEDPDTGFECYGECEKCSYKDCADREEEHTHDYEAEEAERILEEQEAILEDKYKDYEPY